MTGERNRNERATLYQRESVSGVYHTCTAFADALKRSLGPERQDGSPSSYRITHQHRLLQRPGVLKYCLT